MNIGGEGQESCSRLTSRMYMYELAKENNALLVNVEHRFYGQSYPTLDMTTANLKYLSSEQGLADLARVITQVKTDLHTENRYSALSFPLLLLLLLSHTLLQQSDHHWRFLPRQHGGMVQVEVSRSFYWLHRLLRPPYRKGVYRPLSLLRSPFTTSCSAQGNFFEYMEVVADAIDYFSGPECFRQFTEAAEVVAELASRGVG